MTEETPSTDSKQQLPDLSGLADFQFGPAWARAGARKEYSGSSPAYRDRDRQGDRRPRRDNRDDRRPRGERRFDGQGEKRFNRDDRSRGPFRGHRDGDRYERPARAPQAEPAEGLRVELRPVDSGLAALSQEVQKHRRTISLMDLAKVVMGAFDRYDLVFMKQENGPDLYHCKHGDGALLYFPPGSRQASLERRMAAPVLRVRGTGSGSPQGRFQGDCQVFPEQ